MPPNKKPAAAAAAAAVSSNSGKQSNLFSFFTKKPKDASAMASTSNKSQSPAQVAPASSSSTTNNSNNNNNNSNSALSKSQASSSTTTQNRPSTSNGRRPMTTATTATTTTNKNAKAVAKVQIGTKIAVFWPDDRQYYAAVVKRERQDRTQFYLEYEDGENEWIDLRQEQFRFIQDDDEEDDDLVDSDEEEEEMISSSQKSSRLHKRPRISEDSEEEEFEMDEEEANDDDDDDELSADEEEENEWMVSEDEGDGSSGSKRKAPTSGRKHQSKATKTAVKVTKHSPAQVSASQSSASKTPKATVNPNMSSTSTVTPKSLANFSAFSDSTAANNTQSNAPKRVTPLSSSRSSSTSLLPGADTDYHAMEGVLPYEQGVVNPVGAHVHNHLQFLQNPRDSKGRTKDHPDYDPRTLKVDFRELEKYNAGKKVSPGVQQWWECKAQYFDTVLLFKTGKFYELHNMDADIGVCVCSMVYMKGHFAHCGFPESAYGKMADSLCRAGYKVARVEQTETPEMLKVRKTKTARGGKKPQVVNREVCSIMTMGTRTFCYLDKQLESDGFDVPAGNGPLLAIREIQLENTTTSEEDEDTLRPVCEYGIVVVDAARAEITIGQFADDVLRSRMTTLLAAMVPSEILLEGGENGASSTLYSLLKTAQTTSPQPFSIERVNPVESFPKSTAIDANIRRKLERTNGRVQPWDVKETLEELHRREYFPRGSRQDKNSSSTSRWPSVLRAAVEGNAELALSCLGAALFYLQRNMIDEEILTMGLVKAYVPPVTATAPEISKFSQVETSDEDMQVDGASPAPTRQDASSENTGFTGVGSANEEDNITHMAIDGNTLCQLEILTNSIDHKVEGSLWSKIRFTKTPHGAKLLRAWLLRPLFRKTDIDRRADAVEELVSGDAAVAMSEASTVLAKTFDLERLLAKVHSMSGNKYLLEDEDPEPNVQFHPDARAILYETKTYTKRKLQDFNKVLSGLRSASRIPEIFSNVHLESGLLQKIVRFSKDSGCFPDISEDIDWFFSAFDFEKAANGEFEPDRGIDEAYDEACDAIEEIHSALDSYRGKMISTLQPLSLAKQWKYTNVANDSKDKFTIELPKAVKVPKDFHMIGKRGSGTKQINKYRTPTVEAYVESLERAISVMTDRKARQMQLIFARFDAKRTVWAAVAKATALLDALGSLAQLGSKPGWCRPKILECPPDSSPVIRIEQGRHPCVESTPTSGEFIPNDLRLGGSPEMPGESSEMVLLLSGPNMGGKSTLLRQTCLISILAQIGGFVPALSCELTPIDKVFTRLGASDRILLGQSTFFVELAETAAALRGASRRSLILMDELGRGTSSFDGTAIASACLDYICKNLKCLSLFATHYHSLLDEWKSDSKVRLGHMESVVNDDDNENDNQDQGNITFLYTLGGGACPKSFGVNVARLARLPEEVLCKAQRISTEFEKEMDMNSRIAPGRAVEQKRQLAEWIQEGKVEDVEALWEELQQH